MAIHKLDRIIWEEFFRTVSQAFARECHEIEILTADERVMNGGWMPAASVDYDSYDKALDLASELTRVTLFPHELYADLSERGLEGLCILDRERGWHIVLLRHPLQLAAPKLATLRFKARGRAF